MIILRVLFLSLLVTLVSGYTYCTGDLTWKPDAPICVSTCPQRFYYQECPNRTIGRCVCPEHRPVLRRENEDICVSGNSCESPDWFKLGPNNIANFKFETQPQDATVTVGRSLTLSCAVISHKPVQYYWYKMNKLPSGDMTSDDNLYMAGTTQIVLSVAKVTDAGFYQCKAKSQDGYSLLSSVSQIRIKHTSFDSTVKTVTGVVINKGRVILECKKASASYPRATIQWTKDGSTISAADIFQNSKAGEDEFGYLYILNVKAIHAGTYKCIATVNDGDVGGVFVLSEVEFKIKGSQNQVEGSPVALKKASYGDQVEKGGTAVLFCAAYGFPAPKYTWTRATTTSTATTISGCGEKTCVEDYGRRLKIYNVDSNDYGGYFCQANNGISFNSQVLNLDSKPKSYEINFLGISPSYTITPNRYDSFNLTCAVDIISSDKVYIGWYKDGESVSGSSRIYTEDILTTESRIRKLVFKYPTDNDPGLYQCLAYNSERFVQASTDITIDRYDESTKDSSNLVDSELWEPDSPFELKLFTDPKGIQDAYATCATWKPKAQLVSILDNAQNDRVFRLLQEGNVTKAWIGLSDETVKGRWEWFTQESSSRYSNWKYNEPDNAGNSGSDYAVMDVKSAGKWEDMTNSGTAFPFVCKYYNSTCPLVANDNQFKDYSVTTYVKGSGADIRAFDKAVVSCKSGQTSKIICGTSGKWVFPYSSQCEPQAVLGGTSPALSLHLLLLLPVIFLIYR